MTRSFYDWGQIAYHAGEPEMHRVNTGAEEFNAGWADAQHQEYSERRNAELEIAKARICDLDGDLDVDALVDVLHELGIRSW